MVMDLVAFLRAQLDDDERVAQETTEDGGGRWRIARYTDRTTTVWDGDIQVLASLDQNNIAEHIARWDPVRVLAEVDAKRRILDRYEDTLSRQGEWEESQLAADICAVEYQDWILPILALPYADREGYRDEWRP
jgi:hypothetical protein